MQPKSAAEPRDYAVKGTDSIEWIAFWDFPQTKEGQLERMLTTELQRRTLWALQDKQYLKAGKDNNYWFDPFQVTNMRTGNGGIYELDVLAFVHKVINNEIDKKTEKYQITFRHDYDKGFVVTNVSEK